MIQAILTLAGAILFQIWFQIVRVLFGFIQNMIWTVNGVHDAREKSKTSKKSAEVLDIVWKYKIDILAGSGSNTLSDFITSHNAFVHPEYVLQDHVTLYIITPTEAIFVESDPQVDVTHSSTHFFFYAAQYIHARRIVRVPMESFLRLADQLPDQNGTMVFLSSTGRCGSTLFSQMFEQTNHCLSISEPFFLSHIMAQRKILPDKDFKRLLSASIRILCKPVDKADIQAYIIKTQAFLTNMMPLFAELFPKSKQLFMYRDGVKVSKSYYEFTQRFKTGILVMLIAKITTKPFKRMFEDIGVKFKFDKDSFNFEYMGIYLWADCCSKYLKYHQEGTVIGGVKHEDILASPVDALRAIMVYCGLPEEWAPAAVKAMEQDSMESLKNKKTEQNLRRSNLDEKFANKVCDLYGVPSHNCVLPGTVTHKG